MLKGIIVMTNEKTADIGSILAIARATARKRENSPENPPIRALRFLPEIGAYIAVYEAVDKVNAGQRNME